MMDSPSSDRRTDVGSSVRSPGGRWVWILLLTAGVAVAVASFYGYGQSALLLEAVNLRYCG